jgi:hypothetical protein
MRAALHSSDSTSADESRSASRFGHTVPLVHVACAEGADVALADTTWPATPSAGMIVSACIIANTAVSVSDGVIGAISASLKAAFNGSAMSCFCSA